MTATFHDKNMAAVQTFEFLLLMWIGYENRLHRHKGACNLRLTRKTYKEGRRTNKEANERKSGRKAKMLVH
jgi:hypothetical protein